MLEKTQKINREVFNTVFKSGKVYNSDIITLHLQKADSWDDFGVSIVVPKKVSKLAVKRNLLKEGVIL